MILTIGGNENKRVFLPKFNNQTIKQSFMYKVMRGTAKHHALE